MLRFILNNQDIETELPPGMTVLDFVRYKKNLTGTKIGCREGDCGACTVLVGELNDGSLEYRSMTSCLMPLANADGKHIVTVEGINRSDGGLTPVQQALVDESGTQCGFCTVGFVMSMTGFCIDGNEKTCEMAVSAIDGNICRCTGYKSIERAAGSISKGLALRANENKNRVELAVREKIVPDYFTGIRKQLGVLKTASSQAAVGDPKFIVGGGTDLYVQKHDEIAESDARHVFYDDDLRGITESAGYVRVGASATVTDMMISPIMKSIFPDMQRHLKLVSSTPIRNMATIGGNFVNASPIGDMTIWFLALDAEIVLSEPDSRADKIGERTLPLKDFFRGYKELDMNRRETVRSIRFKKPSAGFRFNFEKVCKRTYLDIATVNTAISLQVSGSDESPQVDLRDGGTRPAKSNFIIEAHMAAGGVAPIPLYLRETSSFLKGKKINAKTVTEASEIIQDEIKPISDVRGSESYKRLLLKRLFEAHFFELFGFEPRLDRLIQDANI